MRNYIPALEVFLDPECGDARCKERLGGVPFGLRPESWPKCRTCGGSQTLVAQFAHHPDRLDLGREGRMLFVFYCGRGNFGQDGGPECRTWEPFNANACIVIEPEELLDGLSQLPADDPPVENEAFIVGWQERDDGLTEADAVAFFSEATYVHLNEETWERASRITRLGGVPAWAQSADAMPRPDWRFIGQLDGNYWFLKEPEFVADWVEYMHEPWEGFSYSGQGPNFGMGIAYVFLRDAAGPPEACMLWQR